MSMLSLNGVVANCFDTPASTDKKTGEIRPASCRVQIHARNTLENGQVRLELVTLKVDSIEPYKRLEGKTVSVPVGAFALNGSIMYYALRSESVQEA